jgi:hypothetical protein
MFTVTHPNGVQWVATRWFHCVRGPGFCKFLGPNELTNARDYFSDKVIAHGP